MIDSLRISLLIAVALLQPPLSGPYLGQDPPGMEPKLFAEGIISTSTPAQDEDPWPVLRGPYLGQSPPGMDSEVFAPGIISLEGRYELNSIFTPNGEEFFFAISATSQEEKAQGIYFYYLLHTEIVDGVWTKPERFPVAGNYSAVDIALSPDGNRLYFCSDMPAGWDTDGELDIWYTERTGDGWSPPVNLGKTINSPKGETQPSFTSDCTIYFPSEREGSKAGGKDLYYATLSDDGYSEPLPLPDEINSEYYESNSFVAPDGSYVLFARYNMPESIDGGKALYISFRTEDGGWTPAKNTRPETDLYGSLAALSPDGKYLFYSAGGDIYWVDAKVIEKLRPGH